MPAVEVAEGIELNSAEGDGYLLFLVLECFG